MDGEPVTAVAGVDAHLRGCAACRAWEAAAHDVTRVFRIRPAEAVPDLWPAVREVVSAQPAVREAVASSGRWLLAAVAIGQLLVAIPGFLLGHGDGLTNHLAREAGGLDVALAVGFLYAAWRPRRIAGMVPLVAALVACHLATAFVDVGLGRTVPSQESVHALELIGLGLLWVVSHHGALVHRPSRPRPA